MLDSEPQDDVVEFIELLAQGESCTNGSHGIEPFTCRLGELRVGFVIHIVKEREGSKPILYIVIPHVGSFQVMIIYTAAIFDVKTRLQLGFVKKNGQIFNAGLPWMVEDPFSSRIPPIGAHCVQRFQQHRAFGEGHGIHEIQGIRRAKTGTRGPWVPVPRESLKALGIFREHLGP